MTELAKAVMDPGRGSVKPREVMQAVGSHFEDFQPKYGTAWKAVASATSASRKEHNKQWRQLPAYLRSLREADPGARIDFQPLKVFISPSTAPKTASLCKPVIYLDACHLKGPLETILLLAVAQDGANHICILAWAVARVEDEVTWRWFLSHLRQHMPFINHPGQVVCSDRQKGLQNGLDKELPHAKKAYCCLHLRNNVRKNCGARAADFFWSLVFQDTKLHFDELYARGFGASALRGVTEYLNAIDLRLWARPYFGAPGRFGSVTSNPVEQSNAWLELLRAKPVVELLHGLRDKVTEHAEEMKKEAYQYSGELTPFALQNYQKQLATARTRRAVLVQRGPVLVGKVESGDDRCWLERRVTVWRQPNGTYSSMCDCDHFIEFRILCRHALALLLKAEVIFEPPECVAPFFTTAGWRSVYNELFPLHVIDVDDFEEDMTVVLPRVRGTGAGARKRKRGLPGNRPSQSSQTFRPQN